MKLKKQLTDLLLWEAQETFLKGGEDFTKHGHLLKNRFFKQNEASKDASHPLRLMYSTQSVFSQNIRMQSTIFLKM